MKNDGRLGYTNAWFESCLLQFCFLVLLLRTVCFAACKHAQLLTSNMLLFAGDLFTHMLLNS